MRYHFDCFDFLMFIVLHKKIMKKILYIFLNLVKTFMNEWENMCLNTQFMETNLHYK